MSGQQIECDVFLSHATTDKAAAQESAQRLKGEWAARDSES
jgi:hypothetical protein